MAGRDQQRVVERWEQAQRVAEGRERAAGSRSELAEVKERAAGSRLWLVASSSSKEQSRGNISGL
jgi:hypothetical protein